MPKNWSAIMAVTMYTAGIITDQFTHHSKSLLVMFGRSMAVSPPPPSREATKSMGIAQ